MPPMRAKTESVRTGVGTPTCAGRATTHDWQDLAAPGEGIGGGRVEELLSKHNAVSWEFANSNSELVLSPKTAWNPRTHSSATASKDAGPVNTCLPPSLPGRDIQNNRQGEKAGTPAHYRTSWAALDPSEPSRTSV